MQLDEFITWVFCWVDEEIKKLVAAQPLRQRGFQPALSDTEVVTMECVGELLGYDNDVAIWMYFKQHWLSWFPDLGSRSQFSKHANQLWAVKQRLQEQMMSHHQKTTLSIVDGFPIPVCHKARASRCRRFQEQAEYGYCAAKKEHYYGFKGHLLVNEEGLISGFTLAPANVDERLMVPELTSHIEGVVLGDKGYLSSTLQEVLRQEGIHLEAPPRSNMVDPLPKEVRKNLMRVRRTIETTIGQLVERLNIQKTWARSVLGLTNRLTRKLLAHLFGTMCNKINGEKPLQLARLFN